MDNTAYIAGFTMHPNSEIDDEHFEEQLTDAEHNYDSYNVIDAFDNDNFEVVFRSNYRTILSFRPSDIFVICSMFMVKVEQSLNFKFTPSIIFNEMETAIQFFDFIKFIKYENISFMKNLCIELNFSMEDVAHLTNIEEIKSSKIINIIDNISDKYKYNRLIYDFITTHNRKDLLCWINKQFIRYKSEILLDFIE